MATGVHRKKIQLDIDVGGNQARKQLNDVVNCFQIVIFTIFDTAFLHYNTSTLCLKSKNRIKKRMLCNRLVLDNRAVFVFW